MALMGNDAAAVSDVMQQHLPVPLFKLLAEREEGNLRCLALERAVLRMRSELMSLSKDRTVIAFSGSSISCMDMDETEDRYLLCGYKDGSITVVDVEDSPVKKITKFESVLRVERGLAHRFTVTGCAWYPLDTGMFVTSGFDSAVKVWNANEAKAVCTFDMSDKMYCMAMPASIRHSLVAAGCGNGLVYLCDLRSGSSAQMLKGHRGAAVTAAAWRPAEDFVLITGGGDGTLRLWDIRRTSSCLALLSQEGRPIVPGRGSRRDLGDDLSPPIAHSGGVYSVLYSPDGRYLISSGADHMMRSWDPDTCELVIVNFGNFPHRRGGSHRSVQPAFSRNGPIIYHPRANDVVACNLETGQRGVHLRAHLDHVTCVATQARGESVFTAGMDCNLLVWTPPRTLTGGGNEVEDSDMGEGGDAWSDDD